MGQGKTGPGLGHCPERSRRSSLEGAKRVERERRREGKENRVLTLEERCSPVSKRLHRMKKGRRVARFGKAPDV